MSRVDIYQQIAAAYLKLAELEQGTGNFVLPAPAPLMPAAPVARRIGTWVGKFNMGVKGIAERPDHPQPSRDGLTYIIKDIFTTVNGSWEPSGQPGSIDVWALDYIRLKRPFDDAGGDHHLYGAVLGLDGNLLTNAGILCWSDGFLRLGDDSYAAYTAMCTKASGWANLPIFGPSSSFVPERGEAGPWCWCPLGASEVMCGGGLPANQHISTFVVWQAVKAS